MAAVIRSTFITRFVLSTVRPRLPENKQTKEFLQLHRFVLPPHALRPLVVLEVEWQDGLWCALSGAWR